MDLNKSPRKDLTDDQIEAHVKFRMAKWYSTPIKKCIPKPRPYDITWVVRTIPNKVMTSVGKYQIMQRNTWSSLLWKARREYGRGCLKSMRIT